jgi:hypothetical protein
MPRHGMALATPDMHLIGVSHVCRATLIIGSR